MDRYSPTSNKTLVVSKQSGSPSRSSTPPPSTPPTDLREAILSKAGNLIETLDNIAHIKGIKLEFPQIIVVGEESSGKSTLLERIAMLEIFPRVRERAISTRLPTRLKLQHLHLTQLEEFCKKNGLQYGPDKAYVRLCYEDNEAGVHTWSGFFQIHEVLSQVQKYSDIAVAQKNGQVRGIVDSVMVVEITSNLVPNLSLVDLPGMVSAYIEGEPKDMMEQTRNLVERYLKQPHTLVLAIVPAYQRIRNAICMHLIQKYHKEDQTIGVLTMADKAFQGQLRPNDPFYDLKARLDGIAADCVQLPLGYVAVKNRDNNLTNDDLRSAAATEAKWFDENIPGYRAKGKVSSDCLIHRLVDMLINYVHQTWAPNAKKAMDQEIENINRKLQAIGKPVPTNKTVESFLLDEVLPDFCQQLKQSEVFLSLFSIPSQISVPFASSKNSIELSRNWKDFRNDYLDEAVTLIKIVTTLLITRLQPFFKRDQLPIKFNRFSPKTPQIHH